MAEIAIPLLGLGAMYIISNNKNTNKEAMTNYEQNTNKKSKPFVSILSSFLAFPATASKSV